MPEERFYISPSPDILSFSSPRDQTPREVVAQEVIRLRNNNWGYIPREISPPAEINPINWDLFTETINGISRVKIPKTKIISPEVLPRFRDFVKNLHDAEHIEAFFSLLAGIVSFVPAGPILSSAIIDVINVFNTGQTLAKTVRTHDSADKKRFWRYARSTVGEGIMGIALPGFVVRATGLDFGSLWLGGTITGTIGLGTGYWTNTFWQRIGDEIEQNDTNNLNLLSIQQQLLGDNSIQVQNEVENRLGQDPKKYEKLKGILKNYLIAKKGNNREEMITSVKLEKLLHLSKLGNPYYRNIFTYYYWQMILEQQQIESAARLQDILNTLDNQSTRRLAGVQLESCVQNSD